MSRRSQTASHVHLARALYSDSQEERAVELYLREHHEIGVRPKIKRYALVEIRSSKDPP
jgi:hypothetical protein